MEARSLGLPHHSYCTPYAEAAASVKLKVVRQPPAIVARDLEAGLLAAGFVSPIDFARNASEYRVVPNTGVASREANGSLIIRFRPGLETVRSLAVPAIATSDIILARLLLSERFGITPTLIPVAGSPEEMLTRADAALIASLSASPGHDDEEGLDLIEEWIGATGLPYVHGIIASRDGALTPEEARGLSSVATPPDEPIGEDDQGEPVYPPFGYGLQEDALDGLREFMHYAYFHGILPDVPDVTFLGAEE
jgi:predicted solute-binding protein